MTRFTVLHALALRRKADLDALERSTGMPREEIESTLAAAAAEKLVIEARGTRLLSPAGTAWLDTAYASEFAAARSDPELAAAYDRFEVVNRELKALVTSWQTMAVGGQSVPNDHTDADYDARVIGRLGDLHERAERVIEALARRVPRLSRYTDRLASALERAEAGENEWVSGVRCDSYHTVWFEMHEDLLRLLGRKREE